MAKGGRRAHAGAKRKPTDLKVLQGTFREDRHGDEVTIAPEWPVAPGFLTARQREIWDGLKPKCETWVAPSDWPTLVGFVVLMDKVLRIEEAQGEGEGGGKPLAFKFTPSADGEPNLEPKENPLYTLELKFFRELRSYIGLMGLSPVDRAKVKPIPTETPVNPLERFLKRSKG